MNRVAVDNTAAWYAEEVRKLYAAYPLAAAGVPLFDRLRAEYEREIDRDKEIAELQVELRYLKAEVQRLQANR